MASTKELKHNIKQLSEDSEIMNKLSLLKPVQFTFKSDETNHLQYGLIAEEVEELFPEICRYKNNKVSGVEYMQFIGLLLAKNQQLEKRIQALEQLISN